MFLIKTRERGPVPRRMRRQYNQSSAVAWNATGRYYHATYRPRRFTTAHARAANYTPRAGENLPYGSKAYWRSYIGRKKRSKGHVRPFEWSGQFRRSTRTAAIYTTRSGARVKYRGARVLNFRPDLAAEFRRVLPDEARQLGRIYDTNLSRELKKQ